MATEARPASGVEAPAVEVPTVTAVILAWQDEPWLPAAVRAVLDSTGVRADVVLVDNGCTNTDVADLTGVDGVTVVTPERNLGFAGGCNFGAGYATGQYLALVNSDAIVAPDTLSLLVAQAAQQPRTVAGASIRLDTDPLLLNSAGNPVHVLGLSWAGRMNEPETQTAPTDVAVASGACLVLPRAWWQELGGFDGEYFAYHEDADLSLRTWRAGGRVRYVPTAVAVHRYEFSRNSLKMYLLERNRLLLLATLWSGRSLLLLAPPLLALELAMLALSIKQGWVREKVRGWWWLLRHGRHVVGRRRVLHRELAVRNRDWMNRLTPTLVENGAVALPPGAGVLNVLMRGYWGLIRPVV